VSHWREALGGTAVVGAMLLVMYVVIAYAARAAAWIERWALARDRETTMDELNDEYERWRTGRM
jgi:hypothetical protein